MKLSVVAEQLAIAKTSIKEVDVHQCVVEINVTHIEVQACLQEDSSYMNGEALKSSTSLIETHVIVIIVEQVGLT